MSVAESDERRRQILTGARASFLQFGFAKTSLEDIARRANISRPLIYRTFKKKEEILQALFEDLFEGRYERVASLLAGRGSKREKLAQIYEILYLEPWESMLGSPMARDLFEACKRYEPEGVAKREKMRLKYTQAVLGDRDVAEVFLLAVEGLSSTDIPSTTVLRKRIQILVHHFT